MKGVIKSILRETDFDWVQDISSVPLDTDEGATYFIVDGNQHGIKSNSERLRYLFKLGGKYYEDGVEYVVMLNPIRLGDLEFYHDGDDLDLSDMHWDFGDGDGEGDIEVVNAEKLIDSGYWRPWYNRGNDFNDLNEETNFDWVDDVADVELPEEFQIRITELPNREVRDFIMDNYGETFLDGTNHNVNWFNNDFLEYQIDMYGDAYLLGNKRIGKRHFGWSAEESNDNTISMDDFLRSYDPYFDVGNMNENFDWAQNILPSDQLPPHGQAWSVNVGDLTDLERKDLYYNVIVPNGWMFETDRKRGELTGVDWSDMYVMGSVFGDGIRDGNITYNSSRGMSDYSYWESYGKKKSPTIRMYKATTSDGVEFIEELD